MKISANTGRFLPSLLPGLWVAVSLLALVTLILLQMVVLSGESGPLFSHLGSRDWQVLKLSTLQAGLSVVLSLTVGLVLAWSLSHQRQFLGRKLLIALLSTALVLPTLVVVLGLVTVLGRKGWLNTLLLDQVGVSAGGFIYGLSGILIAHTYLNSSFAVRSLLNRLETIPAEKRKLARSLGLSVWQRFALVEWPTIRSTLPGLGATIFLLCFTSFAIVLTLGGSPRYNTLEVSLYEAVKLDFDIARALDLALLQLIVCAVLVITASGFHSKTALIGRHEKPSDWPERPVVRIIQFLLIVILGLCFLLPLVAVVMDGLQADFGKLFAEATFRRAFVSSLLIATVSGGLTLVIALLLSSAKRDVALPHRIKPSPVTHFLSRLISFAGTLYLAVPSLVLGLGFFLLARQFSGSLNFWAPFALVTANVLMALPFALAILVPAMEKTALRYDRLCFSLDIGGAARWRWVEWPLLRADIGYVCAVSFCLSLGDLGVIALFGSQDFATLPWYLYQKMGSYRTSDAAGVALVMLGLTLFVFLLIPRLFRERDNAET